jgi:UDP-N-acetylglucosamine enolpyruvyl transferase
MKKIFVCILGIVCFAILSGCSRSTEPQIRVRNEQLNKVDIKIETSGKNQISMKGVEPGETTAYQKISEGSVIAAAIIQNESISFIAAKNTDYTILMKRDKPISVIVENK